MLTRLLGTAVPAQVAEGGTSGTTAEEARANLGVVGVLSSTTGIDGTMVGVTPLYTVPMGKTAIIIETNFRMTNANTVTVAGTMGVGVAAGEDDINAPAMLTGLDTTGKVFNYGIFGPSVTVAAGATIKLGIDVGYTAVAATLAVDLLGYLI